MKETNKLTFSKQNKYMIDLNKQYKDTKYFMNPTFLEINIGDTVDIYEILDSLKLANIELRESSSMFYIPISFFIAHNGYYLSSVFLLEIPKS